MLPKLKKKKPDLGNTKKSTSRKPKLDSPYKMSQKSYKKAKNSKKMATKDYYGKKKFGKNKDIFGSNSLQRSSSKLLLFEEKRKSGQKMGQKGVKKRRGNLKNFPKILVPGKKVSMKKMNVVKRERDGGNGVKHNNSSLAKLGGSKKYAKVESFDSKLYSL